MFMSEMFTSNTDVLPVDGVLIQPETSCSLVSVRKQKARCLHAQPAAIRLAAHMSGSHWMLCSLGNLYIDKLYRAKKSSACRFLREGSITSKVGYHPTRNLH
jgi:hypothetical protein